MSELRELRAEAGAPSFRRMAAKSGAVSHATMHLTVTGRRLQPWETVREFVRACDGDDAEWHARWQGARLLLDADVVAPDAERAPAAEHQTEDDAEPRRPSGWRSKRVLIPVAVGLAAAFAVVTGVLIGTSEEPPPVAAAPEAPPVFPGDSSKFIRDVTYPDDTAVEPGARFVKVWELQNSGEVPWRHRYLQRTDVPPAPGNCHTPARVPVKDTAPGQLVQVTVSVTAPTTAPVGCKVYWKMVDETGRELLPSHRPIFFAVQVR